MEISKEKFKKIGVSAIIAAVGFAALFQLGSVVKDKIYDINAEQYTAEQTVRYGSITDFKIESLLRSVQKQVDSEEQWNSLPDYALSDIKQIKELIKSEDFRQLVQNENIYRAAENSVNFSLGWDLNATTFNNDEGKRIDILGNFKHNMTAFYSQYSNGNNEISPQTLNHEDKIFTGKIDLEKVSKAHEEDLFAVNGVATPEDPLEFSKVKDRIQNIRTQNQEVKVGNSFKHS